MFLMLHHFGDIQFVVMYFKRGATLNDGKFVLRHVCGDYAIIFMYLMVSNSFGLCYLYIVYKPYISLFMLKLKLII